MNSQKNQELQKLFNRFAEEEQASSFAVSSLYQQTVQIISEETQRPLKEEKE